MFSEESGLQERFKKDREEEKQDMTLKRRMNEEKNFGIEAHGEEEPRTVNQILERSCSKDLRIDLAKRTFKNEDQEKGNK